MVGLEEGIFPHSRSLLEGQLEEERRLAYVGMTRAQKKLVLSCARVRTLYGNTKPNLVSGFVEEIDDSFVEFKEITGGFFPNARGIVPKPQATKLADNNSYRAGDKVRHKVWGEGMVVSVSDSHGDQQLSIAFPNQGIKTVIAH